MPAYRSHASTARHATDAGHRPTAPLIPLTHRSPMFCDWSVAALAEIAALQRGANSSTFAAAATQELRRQTERENEDQP